MLASSGTRGRVACPERPFTASRSLEHQGLSQLVSPLCSPAKVAAAGRPEINPESSGPGAAPAWPLRRYIRQSNAREAAAPGHRRVGKAVLGKYAGNFQPLLPPRVQPG